MTPKTGYLMICYGLFLAAMGLAVDDEAWAVVDPPARAKIMLVTPGNDALQLALTTESAAVMILISASVP